MQVAVLFTGLPRMEDRFKQSIEQMSSLANQGYINDIIFVTWNNVWNGKSQLRSFLLKNDVKIIEAEESPIGGFHNVWHQMKALDIGLEAIPSDYYVLRTRPEVYIETEFLKKLFDGKIDELHTSAGSGIFNDRIWISFFETHEVFRYSDYCFFGNHDDLYNLVNYDARYDVLWNFRMIHVRMFIDAYLEKYPFLQQYLSKYDENWYSVWHGNNNIKNRKEFIKARLESPVYGSIIGFYYKVTMNDFYVDYNPVYFKENKKRPLEPLSDDSYMNNFITGKGKDRKRISCWDNDWLKSQFFPKANSDIPDPIIKGFYRSFDEWEGYKFNEELLDEEVVKEKEYIEEIQDVNLLKSPLRWIGKNVLNR